MSFAVPPKFFRNIGTPSSNKKLFNEGCRSNLFAQEEAWMRAAFFQKYGGPEVLEIGTLPEPEPKATEVRVKVRAAAMNHLDIWIRKGEGGVKVGFPRIPCADGAGIVDKIGSDVSRFAVGDEVIVHPGVSCGHCEACLSLWETCCPDYQILGEHRNGTAAELIAVPEANLFQKPEALSFEEAASLPLVFTTAWQMVVRRGEIKPGDLVLIHAAASGVSSAAIQIARLYGAEVIATAGSEAKLALAKQLGAHHTIHYTAQDFLTETKKIAGKRGVDIIFDHTGKDQWAKNLRAVKGAGKIVICGASSGYEAPTDLRHIFYRQLSVLGSTMGSKADFPSVLKQVEKGALKAVVDRSFPLDQIADAHRYLEGRSPLGKVVLKL
jgi:NADPH:quinone reductase-like Zn-dependent oxidoreductase